MKRLLTLFLLLSSVQAHAKIKLNLEYKDTSMGYFLQASNEEYCPVTIKLTLNISNLKPSIDSTDVFVIPARTKNVFIMYLHSIDSFKPYRIGYSFSANYGDHTDVNYDEDFAYHLPYPAKKKYPLSQGYNGKVSHVKENALDFSMPVGTEVSAVRDGLVVTVVESNYKRCASSVKCAKYNNYIRIFHNDGTFSEYAHIKQNGALVSVGDSVIKGQPIAKSGNVGYTNGPHLHLIIYRQTMDKRISIKTDFLIHDGSGAAQLKEGRSYIRRY